MIRDAETVTVDFRKDPYCKKSENIVSRYFDAAMIRKPSQQLFKSYLKLDIGM
jgi:hypothetical protein